MVFKNPQYLNDSVHKPLLLVLLWSFYEIVMLSFPGCGRIVLSCLINLYSDSIGSGLRGECRVGVLGGQRVLLRGDSQARCFHVFWHHQGQKVSH